MRLSLIGIALLLASAAAPAQSDVYVCVTENGTKEYRNTNITRNCKRMDLPAGTNIPAPAAPAAPRKSVTQVSTPRPAASPDGYPRVDPDAQRARDNDRRQILLDELAREEKKLAAQKTEFNNGEPERRGDERNYQKYLDRVAAMKNDMARTEQNIEALKREIGKLK